MYWKWTTGSGAATGGHGGARAPPNHISPQKINLHENVFKQSLLVGGGVRRKYATNTMKSENKLHFFARCARGCPCTFGLIYRTTTSKWESTSNIKPRSNPRAFLYRLRQCVKTPSFSHRTSHFRGL